MKYQISGHRYGERFACVMCLNNWTELEGKCYSSQCPGFFKYLPEMDTPKPGQNIVILFTEA